MRAPQEDPGKYEGRRREQPLRGYGPIDRPPRAEKRGVQRLPARITALDPTNPVYTPAETQVDLFVAYRTRLFADRVRANFQLNVKNAGEKGGGLLPTAVFPDGSPLAYRIVDPRQFILSASFDL